MPSTSNFTDSLIQACRINDLHFLQEFVHNNGSELIAATVDPLWKDSLLHIAQASQSTDVVEFLALNAPQLITQCNKLGVSPFHLAIEEDNQHSCDVYIRSVDENLLCVDLDARDLSSRTLLHYAANKGHLGLTQFLLAHGANAHCYDNLNYTPYDLACSFYPKVAALLNPIVEPSLFSRCAMLLFRQDLEWAQKGNLPLEVAAKAAQVFNSFNQNQDDFLKNQDRKTRQFRNRR